MSNPGEILPAVARDWVGTHFGFDSSVEISQDEGYLAKPAGVFVTIRTRGGELRGCRGTINSTCDNVIEETRQMALSSALEDTRFEPVRVHELENLTYEVSVLHEPEPAESLAEFDPFRYGIIVRDRNGRRALMLPNVDGLDTVQRQYDATCRKGGIDPQGPVELERFQVDKFVET
ncbi:MAG: AmmeMemoRadiSam system protein A [Limisphaerales bacterium]